MVNPHVQAAQNMVPKWVEGVLGQVLTDRIWSPSSDFWRPKHGQNYTAASFRQKGVWSQIQIHHLTFYDPSQSLCFRVREAIM